jgi:putative ABC transport system ATP-binding protein
MMHIMALIEVHDLVKTYIEGDTETRVLKGVSFKVEKGEFVAIMGPSGSGKSTLLHMLGFLDEPTSGEYIFDSHKRSSFSEDELSVMRNNKIGFIFQAFNLLPKTTVLENVKLPLLYSNVPKSKWDEKAMAVIEMVGLTHRLQHESNELSGGEKQRVAIARALVNDPQIIFADEPTGNLDSKSGKAVMDFIQNLHEEKGYTILLITHETATAEHAERIIRIQDGEIAKDEKVKNRRRAGDIYEK